MNQVTDVNIPLYFESATDLLLAVVNSKAWQVANNSDLADPNMDGHLQSIIQSLSLCATKYSQYKDTSDSHEGSSSKYTLNKEYMKTNNGYINHT